MTSNYVNHAAEHLLCTYHAWNAQTISFRECSYNSNVATTLMALGNAVITLSMGQSA